MLGTRITGPGSSASSRCWPSKVRLGWILAAGLLSCRAPAAEPAVLLMAVTRDGAAALAVFPATGVRINALAAPALELQGAPVVRLTRGDLTADSAYFAEPPWIPRTAEMHGSGRLRVSWCRVDELVCQSEKVAVHLEPAADRSKS